MHIRIFYIYPSPPRANEAHDLVAEWLALIQATSLAMFLAQCSGRLLTLPFQLGTKTWMRLKRAATQ